MQIMRVSIEFFLHLHVSTLELSRVSGTDTHTTLTLTPHVALCVSVYPDYACIYRALCEGMGRIR